MIVLLWLFGFFSFLALVVGGCRETYCTLTRYTHLFTTRENDRHASLQQKIQDCFDTLIAVAPSSKKGSNTAPKGASAGGKKPKKQKIFLNVVPHTNRFNMAVFFKEGQELYKQGLMRLLRQRIGHDADQIISEMRQKGQWVRSATKTIDPQKTPLSSLNDLAKIPFTDRAPLYKLLKEGLSTECLFEPDRTLYQISVHYASEEVLAALLDNAPLAHAIVQQRTTLYNLEPRVLQSNKKTRVSDHFLKQEDLEALFKQHGLLFENYNKVLSITAPDIKKVDLAHDNIAY